MEFRVMCDPGGWHCIKMYIGGRAVMEHTESYASSKWAVKRAKKLAAACMGVTPRVLDEKGNSVSYGKSTVYGPF